MRTTEMRKDFQRFQRGIGRALSFGLETNVAKEEMSKHSLGPDFKVDYGPNAAYVRHSAVSNDVNLQNQLLLGPESAEVLRITFAALPPEMKTMFQRLNIRQRADDQVLGLAFGRFPIPGLTEEKSAFHAMKEKTATDGYLNLDCLSRSASWNPLFVKYRLAVIPSLKERESGYVRIDVARSESREITVTVTAVRESEVPDVLKSSETLPR